MYGRMEKSELYNFHSHIGVTVFISHLNLKNKNSNNHIQICEHLIKMNYYLPPLKCFISPIQTIIQFRKLLLNENANICCIRVCFCVCFFI